MVDKKRKLFKKIKKEKVLFITTIASAFVILCTLALLLAPQKVELLYFRNNNCELIHNTDGIIGEAVQKFGDKINVRVIDAQLYPTDSEDTAEIRQLRGKYNVIGLPDIVIDGEKFTKQFTGDNLFAEICNKFIVKPEAC
jgi:thiol-disulfide isomerase/thioredoxin